MPDKKYILRLYNKDRVQISQYGPVNQIDAQWAYRFASQVFAGLMKQFPGSYIIVEEVH